MKNLLKFEFHKLFRQKSFYICAAVMLVMSYVGLLLSKALADSGQSEIIMPTAKSSLLSAVSSSNFTVICGIFIALFVCSDYDQQTVKNVYSRGFSKSEVYFAKFIVCALTTAVMFALTLAFTFLVGTGMFGKGDEKGNVVGLIAGQLIYCLACASFVFALSLAVKKVGVSIALAILGPSLIGAVAGLVDAFLKIEKVKISSYWLDGFIQDLTSFATDNKRLAVCAALSFVYAAVFVLVGYLIGKKQEN